MTPLERRIAVAKAMGWTDFGLLDDGRYKEMSGVMDGLREFLPNFGSPDWSATGEIIDEMRRRGWNPLLNIINYQWHVHWTMPNDPEPVWDVIHGEWIIEPAQGRDVYGPCIHAAVADAFLAACNQESPKP